MEMNESSAEPSADPTETTAQNTEADVRYIEHERLRKSFDERRAAAFSVTKAAIFDVLSTAGVTRVTIGFEGSSDEGQMEDVTAFNSDEEEVELPEIQIEIPDIQFHEDRDASKKETLRTAVETLAYELLEQTHDGWEDGHGGFGTFTFDVAKQSVTLDYDERYTETNNFVHTF